VTPQVEVVPGNTAELGTVDRPFLLVFLPSDQVRVVEVRGGFLAEALTEATGYHFELIVPVDTAEAARFVCDSPQEVIAITSAEDYVAIQDSCGAQLTHAATRFDVPYSLGMLVAREDRVINVFEDLQFKTVGVPSFDDLATYELFARRVEELEIPSVEFVEYGTSSSALIAMLDGEIDLAAAVFNPPILPREERVWVYGEDRAEVWRQVQVEPVRNPIGYVDVLGTPEQGGYRIRDARAAIFDDFPEIFAETRIIDLSEPVPNEAILLGREFPIVPAQAIITAVENFANSEACAQSLCASDFYQWTGIEPVDDSFYDILRNE